MAEFGSELYFRVAFISLLLSLASGDCVDLDLGMENGTIPDSKITASSEQNSSTAAYNGRLNYTLGSSWCAGTSDSNQYLQIDLQTLHIICAVSTQGNSQADAWVKTYTLKLSKDGPPPSWTDYKEDGLVKTFEGNNDRNSEVRHILYKVLARYLRFLPKTHHGQVCMRTEVFGVKVKPENLALGKSTAQSSTYNYSSAISGVSGNAVDGNPDTDFQNGHCSHTNLANPSWWRVDLGANLVPVSEIFIVNRFSSWANVQQRNKDYKITLGSSPDVTTNDKCEGLYSFVDFKASAVCFINPLITGRYVGIMTTKSQILQLCEVEVYSRENLAFGKPTYQYSGTYKDGKSYKAVDGNSNTHFQYGNAVGSCTMTITGKARAWWRVDLQQVHHVSEVYIVNRGSECNCPDRFKNFEIRVGMDDDGQSSANPKCGDTYTNGFPVGEGKSFFCHPSLRGRYVIIRFVDKNKPLTLCEVEVYSERRACPMQAIGVASSDAFPDNRFSASSTSGSDKASKGRLNGDGAWLPSDNSDPNDYLQIYLLYEYVICAVATQGNPTSNDWTTKYKIQLALIDLANNWLTYQEDGVDKVFNGNSGKDDIVKHSLKKYASARFIRFQPTTYNNHKALRVEVFGILISTVPSQAPSGFAVAANSSTSITASWQLPPKYGRHGIITGFKLFYVKKASESSPAVLTYNDVSLTRLVSGLDKYTEYEFQVLAFTSVGDGPKSSVVIERTKEDAPTGAPGNFNATAGTSTSIEASWQLPPEDSRNGNITGFKLFYQKTGSETSTMLTIPNQGSLSKNVTELEKYTEYEFQVLAYTSVGDGPNSSSILKRTKEDVPSQPPTIVSVTAKTSTSIEVSWKLPPKDAWNGVIKGFKLYYEKKHTPGSLTTFLLVDNGAARSAIVSSLTYYTDYQFKVLAYTSVGDGPKSSVKYGKTMEDRPSKAPSSLSLTVKTSTSIEASWQLPPAEGRNGIITGFKLFYKKKGSSKPPTQITIDSGSTMTQVVTGLAKFTEYEFQVLAFTSAGDGPKSSAETKRTKEDAPGIPLSLTYSVQDPVMSNGPRIKLTWQKPAEPNGVIRSYTVSYSHSGNAQKEILEIHALSYTVEVLGGIQYQFYVRAVTIKPGPDAFSIVNVPEYRPIVGPADVLFDDYNETTFNISWTPLTREKSRGKVILYDVKQELLSRGKRRKRSPSNSTTLNTTATFVILYDLPLCSQYNVFVRAYTSVGSGPYTRPRVLETSKPEEPTDLKATNSGSTDVTLEWTKPKVATKEGLDYTVKYSGTKLYNKTFNDTGYRNVGKSTTYKVAGLVPGTNYQFQVYGTSVCGQSSPIELKGETKVVAPIAPVVGNVTDVTVPGSVAGIYLWPVEQRNGPISAYQVIVLKVVDGAEDLPGDYDSRLNSNEANKDNLNFYITAEIQNVPVYEKSWEFTVGDDTTHRDFVNKPLEKGEEYVIFQRAVTRDKDGNLAGVPSKVAKISVTPKDIGATDESKHSGSSNAAAIAVPVVLLLLIIPAVVVAVFWYRRRKQSEPNRDRSRRTPVELDDLKNDSPDLTASTSNLVYQNVAQLQKPGKAVDKEVPPPEEKEDIYSEAEDGNPKPIPVAEFARYFKSKSENGAIVLREEFKNLPGGMQFPWEIGKANRVKNRYGNIVSYDHSRVVLEKIEGDPKSDYINASYIPTFDEVSMCYIATQGPTATSISDFWRMIWQENCLTIVMLTNLVELGKAKCDQYWPENTTKYGTITVTLHKTENFADYVVRTLILVKNSEKREVHQFHYVTWPDKGVPQHSTALLGFRSKIHARHQATGGPLVVHCSAGVGRTGTYIAIDAMLEGAKENKSVFIQNYVQVMRRCRPHMVQKDDQYVFLHQAVMEALVGGDTEIAPHDLRITMNKLARIHKTSKQIGYAREFKRLELVTDIEASPEEATAAFKPSNIDKNRFPNVVPLDIARVFLKSSDPDKNYVNASFVDDYRLRNAYILTQAPLDNTVEDFWRMISQYDIGTVVMLNSLREGKESYPQYWPAEGSQVKHGDITVQILSENTSDRITTRKFSVSNAEPPKKTSTVNHLQFTGWANSHSCPDTREILELLTAIQHSQQQTGNGVIVFQCSDGVGRSGCVSTIMSVIERVKSEQTVDVFQTVKLIRAKRPGAVLTLEQYMFCYQTILAYLDSFNTYANFADC